MKMLPKPAWNRRDDRAKLFVWSTSLIVFAAVLFLNRFQWPVDPGFDVHLFARINALINGVVSFLLILGFLSARKQFYTLHRILMMTSIFLSMLFLLSYICHHLLSGNTAYGGTGWIRYMYFFLLITHIFLAGIILPFILFTAYRALTGEYERHRKLARITFPIWLYVSVTGVILFLMIEPYYR